MNFKVANRQENQILSLSVKTKLTIDVQKYYSVYLQYV